MKGSLTLKVLEIIQQAGITIGELAVVLTSPRGSSYRQIEYRLDQYRHDRRTTQMVVDDSVLKNRSFNDLIYRLRRDRLIVEIKRGDKEILKPTRKGIDKFENLKIKSASALPSQKLYQKTTDNLLKIILFDIPEKDRHQRRWLRSVLVNLGFKMLQKSVWIGKSKIPENLLEDFKRLKLIKYIEIIAITKTGSLKPLFTN